MTATYKNFFVALLILIYSGMVAIHLSEKDGRAITQIVDESPSESVATPVMIPVKYEPRPANLNELLDKYYHGSTSPYDERAFKRVLKWKEDFEGIADGYDHVNWKILASIVKAETQGRTGKQVSSAMAVGMPQIKYQGAWAFYWDAMFSKKIRQGRFFEKDYYNAGIRSRYSAQLKRISQHLQEKDILATPPESTKSALTYRQARSDTWGNLKTYLKKDYQPGEYQVAVDIAAMYIDHLIDTFYKIRRQVKDIKRYVEQNRITNINDIQALGTKSISLTRIKEYLEKNPEYETTGDVQERTLAHINNILNRFEDPNIFSSAYNFGPRNVLEHIHSEKNWPASIDEYVDKVATYNKIFMEIEKFSNFV